MSQCLPGFLAMSACLSCWIWSMYRSTPNTANSSFVWALGGFAPCQHLRPSSGREHTVIPYVIPSPAMMITWWITLVTRRKPTTGTWCPTLFDEWHRIFYMPKPRWPAPSLRINYTPLLNSGVFSLMVGSSVLTAPPRVGRPQGGPTAPPCVGHPQGDLQPRHV